MDLLTELTRANHDPAVIAQVRALMEQSAKAQLVLAEKDFKITALTLELAYYRRIKFGKKSEALSGEQRELFEETVNTDLAAIQAELVPPDAGDGEAGKRKRSRAGRQPLPAELPRVEHLHEPESCQCAACGQGLVKIGEDISEQLDVEPARFFVHRHIRPQYACRACETVTAAPVSPAIIDGGMAAPGLLAWVAVSKYTDHLPLYRIEQIGARQGVPLARSTLAEWIGKIGVALQPLSERLAELLKERPCLHADETPVRQLDPGEGKTRHAYLRAYRSNDLDEGPRIVVFDYQTGRAGAHARAFLSGWQGQLMVDDYAGYKAMFAAGITELACTAHVRRKFFDLHAANGSPIAAEALRRIGQLYAIEEQGRELAPTKRLQLRQTRPSRCWPIGTPGCLPRTRPWPPAAAPPRRSTMPSSAGRRCYATPIRARCRSITTRSRTPYVRSPSARRTGCSPALNGPGAVPPRSRPCSPPPSSTDSNPYDG